MAMTILSLNTERNKVEEFINTHLRTVADVTEIPGAHADAEEPGTLVLARADALQPAPHAVNGSAPAGKPVRSAAASTFASDIAQTLVSAFDSLSQHLAEENQKVNAAVQQQLQQMQVTIDSLKDLWAPVEQLMTAVSEQRRVSAAAIERLERLSSVAGLLQEADVRKRTEIETLRGENRELRAAVGSHGDELTPLKASVAETAVRVARMVELLNKQADVLSQLHQVETNRAAVLERAFADLSRAKSVAA
jgi:dGTP triphosphohydrolase